MILKSYRIRRVAALILLITLIMPGKGFSSFAAPIYSDNLDGFMVDCRWGDNSYDLKWNAKEDGINRIRLIFSYRLENAMHDYAPGSLTVDMPGIGNSCRSSIKKADCLPTDASDTEWGLKWDQNADVYTFFNLFEIKEGQSVNGGFEIVWDMNARDLQNGYTQNRSPAFYVDGAGSITLKPLRFSFTSSRDTYKLTLDRIPVDSTLYNRFDAGYVWYAFRASFKAEWMARGLYLSDCAVNVYIPDAADMNDVVIKNSIGADILPSGTSHGELSFNLFEKRKGDLGSLNKTFSQDFFVGVKEGSLKGGNLSVHVHLDRLYNDEDKWVKKAGEGEIVDAYLTLTADDYEFNYNGLIYRVDMWNEPYENFNKPPYYFWYDYEDDRTHDEPAVYEERMNASDIYNGSVVEFTIRGQAKKDYGPAGISLFNATPSEAASPSNFAETISDNGIPAGTNSDDGIKVIKAGENDSYSLVLGDDVLCVFLEDGSIRPLEDEEYDITYVKVPSDNSGCKYELYGATSADMPFDEYKLLVSSDMSSARTHPLPDGIKAFYVRVNGISGNFITMVTAGVSLHLDWPAEQKKDESRWADHENRIVNFSFLRAICKDAQGKEYNDCKTTSADYGGTYGTELAERDMALYKEWLLRDYSNIWLRGASTNLKVSISAGEFEPEADFYSVDVTVSGTVRSDSEGDICRFSIYTVLPEGLKADFYSRPFTVTGSLTAQNGEKVDFPEDYVSFSEGTYNGSKMIIADFDFTHCPLKADASNRVYISFPVTLSRADKAIYGECYTLSAYLLPHDEGLLKVTGSAITTDEYDIDKNGITNEKMAFAGTYAQISASADEWREFVSKYVKSSYSDGYEADARISLEDVFYEYRLDFGLGSSAASDIIFFDHLETGAEIYEGSSAGTRKKVESEWQGELISVDTSYAQSQGFITTVYYSENADEVFDLASPGWSTVLPDDRSGVRSVAVALDSSQLSGGFMSPAKSVYVIIKMRAPKDDALIGKQAVNQHCVSYQSYGINGEYEGIWSLSSAATYLTLLESIGRVILQKVDADNALRVDDDGITHYATLTGATFQIYDKDGKPLFDSPRGLDSLGRLMVDVSPVGTYYWEEITAPPGYETVPGRHEFLADGFGLSLTVENHRIPGTVTLTKHDQDDALFKTLAGAEFELTMGNGTRVFTDDTYAYSKEGSNSVFKTDEDGTFTITGLPWGNYEFTEIKAPQGYEVSPMPVSFTVGKNSYDSENGNIAIYVDAYDSRKTASLRLIKSDAESGEKISGAVYSLYRESEDGGDDECVASGLKTGMEGEIEIGGLKFGTYYFMETRNPAGYILPDNDERRTQSVTLDASTAGSVMEISHEDERMVGSVRLCKCDDEKRPVAGAVFELFRLTDRGDAELIGTFITGSDKNDENYGEILLDGLEWGDYYFKEVNAPGGYELLESVIPFTIDRDSAQNTVELEAVNERMKGSVKIVKTDESDRKKLLPGAEFALYRAGGEPCVNGVDYLLPEGCDVIRTDETGSITLGGLKQGAYYLKEIKAPDSYSLSSEFIRFSVTMENAAVVQELTVDDEKGLGVLTIDKEVNDVCEAFGDAVFIFKITRSDGMVYYTSITLTPLALKGFASLNLEQGYTYKVEEMSVSRFLPGCTEAVKNVVVDEEENTAIADLVTNDEAEVRFYNEEEQYEKFSHTSSIINSIKSSARLTAASVLYTGPDPITRDLPGFDEEQDIYIIPSEHLEVYAYFDDGTTMVVPAGDYCLTPAYADGNSESYTGTVSVYRDGVQRSASFSVGLLLPEPAPRSLVTYELNGGNIVPTGGTSAIDSYVQRVKTGSSISRPVNDPIRENFRFDGWFLDEDLTVPADFPYTVTADTVIYARWEPEPVNVRYAVSLYGISTDCDSSGNVSGLTFGPALSGNHLNSSRSHVPSAGMLCLHDMTWDEIAKQSQTDPEVFSECLLNGCTHAVDLTIRGALARNVKAPARTTGDGAGVLRFSLNEEYLKWLNEKPSDGSYSTSDIYKVLNGGLDNVKYSLADALPWELRKAIQKKRVEIDDTIWLFSVNELFNEDDIPQSFTTGVRDGKLYERMKLFGNNTEKLTGYAEDGSAVSFWLRSVSSDKDACVVTSAGSYGSEDMENTNGIAFGFCLPGPTPATRLAVSLYGIKHDTYMEENGEQGVAGLTFGPALGEDYTESFVYHEPSGKTKSGSSHRCIHYDDWETIAEWSLKDAYVYEDCLGDKNKPGCTKALDIFLDDKLCANKYSFTGDGSAVLDLALSEDRQSFMYPYDITEYAPSDGGWPASYTRAVLNGADEYTNRLCDGSEVLTHTNARPAAGENPPGKEESIFNHLPARVRAHIVPKRVISDTDKDDIDTLEHTMVTYDRLWLFSVHEIWPQGKRSKVRPNEGEVYERQVRREINGDGSDTKIIAYGENGKTSIALRTIAENQMFQRLGISKRGNMSTFNVASTTGIGFGFCLK